MLISTQSAQHEAKQVLQFGLTLQIGSMVSYHLLPFYLKAQSLRSTFEIYIHRHCAERSSKAIQFSKKQIPVLCMYFSRLRTSSQ